MNSRSFSFSALLLAFGCLAAAQTVPPASPAPNPWNLEASLNYITGDYGLNQDTDVWVQTTVIGYKTDPWRFETTIPLVSISGPASVIGDVGRSDTSTERGLGDIAFAATYKLIKPGTGTSDFDFTARVKLPTADEAKGLGTGKTDANLEINYHHNLGTVTPFATLGYRFLGHSAAYPLQDGFYTTLGLAGPIGLDTTAGLAFSWRDAIVEDADNAVEAMAFVSHQLDARWRVQGYTLAGFTDASPDFGLGGMIGYKF